ncbi:ABC transporter ATP-binding protein [Agreia sp. Leaf283]|uniref:ABC transporter ATP-binding protein n=1 Tax=Agreia sp. Leaf283 TaxID=1736321 RepID=UPI0006F9CA9B|nr:ABC transporter ATP-binding protein [Agreia sp. Leaf283]KQP56083.1 multidrug ABC transporter ATP-binding protein [Agreia sp. Leaf283]
MSDTAGIVVSGVRRSFGDVHAVKNVTFEARPGAVTALVGPNGSGKTTLLLMLATLIEPDAGRIRIAGHDPVTDPVSVRALIGWMPDVLGSWASLTVRTTLQITARLYGMGATRAAARADELVRLIGLDDLADRPTRVLSRGQKQRLSLARALVHDPSVLLLDEPASGLDPTARVELRVLVRRLAQEGRTVLVSSHVLAELDELADAAVYIEGGASVSAERVASAATRARPWRIRALDPGSIAPALVASGVAAESITADATGILVPVTGEEHAAVVLAGLLQSGVAVTSFAPATGDLEHTFLDLQARPAEPGDGIRL